METQQPKLSDLFVSKNHCCLCKTQIKNRAESYFVSEYVQISVRKYLRNST